MFDKNLSLENNTIESPELGLSYVLRLSEDSEHSIVQRQANHPSPVFVADFETVPRGKKGSEKVKLCAPIGHPTSGNDEFVDVEQV